MLVYTQQQREIDRRENRMNSYEKAIFQKRVEKVNSKLDGLYDSCLAVKSNELLSAVEQCKAEINDALLSPVEKENKKRMGIYDKCIDKIIDAYKETGSVYKAKELLFEQGINISIPHLYYKLDKCGVRKINKKGGEG